MSEPSVASQAMSQPDALSNTPNRGPTANAFPPATAWRRHQIRRAADAPSCWGFPPVEGEAVYVFCLASILEKLPLGSKRVATRVAITAAGAEWRDLRPAF